MGGACLSPQRVTLLSLQGTLLTLRQALLGGSLSNVASCLIKQQNFLFIWQINVIMCGMSHARNQKLNKCTLKILLIKSWCNRIWKWINYMLQIWTVTQWIILLDMVMYFFWKTSTHIPNHPFIFLPSLELIYCLLEVYHVNTLTLEHDYYGSVNYCACEAQYHIFEAEDHIAL